VPLRPIVKKSELDKFYTDHQVARDLASEVLNMYKDSVRYVEPSAGDGAFSKWLPSDSIAYDIEPQAEGILQKDFFSVESIPEGTCVIGNPPFGQRNNLSKGFILHSILLGAKAIAFVLPMVYRKPSLQKVFPSDYSLILDKSLGRESFTLEGHPYHVPCCFQVWEKHSEQEDLRFTTEFIRSNSYFSLCKKDDADLFVFGAAPKKIIRPEDVKPSNRGYYIKAISRTKDELKEMLMEIDLSQYGKSSVNAGVYWLTQAELLEYAERELLRHEPDFHRLTT